MEIYRATPVGVALVKSLNTMISEKSLTRSEAVKVLVRIFVGGVVLLLQVTIYVGGI
jgi:hypothetical protein